MESAAAAAVSRLIVPPVNCAERPLHDAGAAATHPFLELLDIDTTFNEPPPKKAAAPPRKARTEIDSRRGRQIRQRLPRHARRPRPRPPRRGAQVRQQHPRRSTPPRCGCTSATRGRSPATSPRARRHEALFTKHDQYLVYVAECKATIAAGALLPHEIAASAMNGDDEDNVSATTSATASLSAGVQDDQDGVRVQGDRLRRCGAADGVLEPAGLDVHGEWLLQEPPQALAAERRRGELGGGHGRGHRQRGVPEARGV
uniref:Uncharacterized protein n=1 Tax=Leersia perrieri TaxID=77586 RepID=A0A0D9XDA6_9ORYZ